MLLVHEFGVGAGSDHQPGLDLPDHLRPQRADGQFRAVGGWVSQAGLVDASSLSSCASTEIQFRGVPLLPDVITVAVRGICVTDSPTATSKNC